MFSLFRLSRSQPVNLATEQADKPEPSPAEGSKANVDLTRSYFESIVSYVTELQQSMAGASPYQFALWLNNGASRIDSLPWGGVDPDLLKYGQSVGDQLQRCWSRSTRWTSSRSASSRKYRLTSNGHTACCPRTALSTTADTGCAGTCRSVTAKWTCLEWFASVSRSSSRPWGKPTTRRSRTLAEIQHETEAMRKLLTQRYGGNF